MSSLRSRPESMITFQKFALPVSPLGELPKRLGPQVKVNQRGLHVSKYLSAASGPIDPLQANPSDSTGNTRTCHAHCFTNADAILWGKTTQWLM